MTDSTKNPPRPKNEVLSALAAAFPVFRDCLPLAVGIHKTIRARQPEIDPASLRGALRFHTASTRYLKALTQGAVRFDLDGKPDGEVSPEQRQQAMDVLRERFKKIAERKKAEEQARQQQEKLVKLAEKFNTRQGK